MQGNQKAVLSHQNVVHINETHYIFNISIIKYEKIGGNYILENAILKSDDGMKYKGEVCYYYKQ